MAKKNKEQDLKVKEMKIDNNLILAYLVPSNIFKSNLAYKGN